MGVKSRRTGRFERNSVIRKFYMYFWPQMKIFDLGIFVDAILRCGIARISNLRKRMSCKYGWEERKDEQMGKKRNFCILCGVDGDGMPGRLWFRRFRWK